MQRQEKTGGAGKRFRSGLKTGLTGLICLLGFLLLLLAPGPGIAGARAGLSLCGDVLIPTLFPFLMLSTFVIGTGLAERLGRPLDAPVRAVFRLPGSAAAALILGLIGGYPVGARACSELCERGALNPKEASRLLIFCINSSPGFIIGAVGAGLFGSVQAGVLLYLAHISSSLILGLLTSFSAPKKDKAPRRRAPHGQTVSEAFVGSVTGAATSIVNICAFVVLFSTFSSLLTGTGAAGSAARVINAAAGHPLLHAAAFDRFLRGFLEVTNGCAAAVSGGNGLWAVLLVSACLSWSGLSVIFQVISLVRAGGISVRPYVLSRLPHMALSVALTLLLFRLFPVALPTFASGSVRLAMSMHTAPASAALLLLCSMLLLSQVRV